MSVQKLFAVVAQGAAKLTTDREISLGMVYRILKSRKPVATDGYLQFQSINKPRFFEKGGYYIMDVDVVSHERHAACMQLFGMLAAKQGVVISADATEADNIKTLDAISVSGPMSRLFTALLNESSGTTIIGFNQAELAESIEAKTMLKGSVELVANDTTGLKDVRISNITAVKAESVSKANGTLVGLFGSEFAFEIDLDAALTGINTPAAAPAVKGKTAVEDVLANL